MDCKFENIENDELNQVNGGGLGGGLVLGAIGFAAGAIGGAVYSVATGKEMSAKNNIKAAVACGIFLGGIGSILPEP